MEGNNQELETKDKELQSTLDAPMEQDSPKKSKEPKRSSKTILISTFCALLVIVAAVLLAQNLPKTISTTEYLEQQYIYTKKPSQEPQPDDGFGNISWYTMYNPNALNFEYQLENNLRHVKISGLKNTAVEEKINNKIIEAGQSIVSQTGNITTVYPVANFFNILSITETTENGCMGALNFDLNTGEQITFQDIFSSKADIPSIVYNAVVRQLQINYNHSLYVGACSYRNKISMMERDPGRDFSLTMCFKEGDTLENLKAERDALIEKSKNIEDEALVIAKSYLAQESPIFYLLGSGPVFVYNGLTYEVLSRDIMDQFAFYERYRSAESLFMDDSIVTAKNLLLPSVFFEPANVYHDIVQEDNNWEEYAIEGSNFNKDSVMSLFKSHSVEKNPDQNVMNFAGYYAAGLSDGVNIDISICTAPKSVFESKIKPEIYYAASTFSGTMGGEINPTKAVGSNYHFDPTKDESVSCANERFFRFISPDGTVYENPEDIFNKSIDYVSQLITFVISKNYSAYMSDYGMNSIPDAGNTKLAIEYDGLGLKLTVTTPQGKQYSRTVYQLSEFSDEWLNPALRTQ